MNCRELAKKKSVNPLWMERLIDLVLETVAKPEPYTAHFILHQKNAEKMLTKS